MMIIIVMGVAGSGKSTIARNLARKLRCKFEDADSYHSPENREKMASGQPLTDEDRKPWLEALRAEILLCIKNGESAVLACSALKKSYREILNADREKTRFVYLKGSYSLFRKRLARRKKHFMKEDMLKSQFEALEEPDEKEATICDARDPVMKIVSSLLSALLSENAESS